MSTPPNNSAPNDDRIKVSLGPDLGTKTFKDFQQVTEWLAKEREFWEFLYIRDYQRDDAERVSEPFDRFQVELNTILTQLRENESEAAKTKAYANQPDRSHQEREDLLQQCQIDYNSYRERIRSTFQSHFEQNHLIASTSPRAKFLALLNGQTNSRTALFAYAYFMRMRIDFGTVDGMQGALHAFCYERGLADTKPFEQQSLSELRTSWESTLQQDRDTILAEIQHQTTLNAQATAQIEEQRKTFSELVEKEKNDWAELHKTYDESLALAKPVTYWQSKATTHRWLAWTFGPLALGAAVLVGVFLYQLIQITLRVPDGTKDPASWHPEYWRIGVLVAAGVFSVWLVRIFVLLFLSHIHLLADANERVTMANTYLALLRSDGGLAQKDRDLILKSLFRQAATGVVKDDGIPLALVEYATKLGK